MAGRPDLACPALAGWAGLHGRQAGPGAGQVLRLTWAKPPGGRSPGTATTWPQCRDPARLRALPAGTAELRLHQCHDAVAGDPRERLPRRLLQRPRLSRTSPRKRCPGLCQSQNSSVVDNSGGHGCALHMPWRGLRALRQWASGFAGMAEIWRIGRTVFSRQLR
jgi:hypothetical protein